MCAGPALGAVIDQDARILHVEPGNAAAQAGIRAGDRLVAIEGTAVRSGEEARTVFQDAASGKNVQQCDDTRAFELPSGREVPLRTAGPARADIPVDVKVERDGRVVALSVQVRAPTGPSSQSGGPPTPIPIGQTYL
jgi:predicted metalloprotease with PDZ domain